MPYLLTGCSCRTWKYKPLVFHTALASLGCMENLRLVFLSVVGSTNQESSQQLRTWFSEHFSHQNILRGLSLVLFLLQRYKYGAKKVQTPRLIRLMRWFDFSQSENRKNNRKLLKEPTKCGPCIHSVNSKYQPHWVGMPMIISVTAVFILSC